MKSLLLVALVFLAGCEVKVEVIQPEMPQYEMKVIEADGKAHVWVLDTETGEATGCTLFSSIGTPCNEY